MKTDKEIKTTDRQINDFREKLSRIIRNVDLIKKGNTHVAVIGKNRLDLIKEVAQDIDGQCKIL